MADVCFILRINQKFSTLNIWGALILIHTSVKVEKEEVASSEVCLTLHCLP